jgi:enamine deaminase RidA (YjgF/YER057c/UK114 family)
MNDKIDAGISAHIGRFSDGVAIPAGARVLHTSGNVGVDANGAVPDDFTAQAENTLANLIKILEAAGMGVGDIVKLTTFMTRKQDLPAYREVRGRVLGDHLPASTLVFVPELVGDNWLIEVELVAAK